MRRKGQFYCFIPIGNCRKHRYTWWFNRPAGKTRRKIARQKKAVETFPRRTAVPLRAKLKVRRQLKVCVGRTSDRISILPDDILVKILSLLPIKEAGRTSVLSKRWRHYWAYIPVLNFDPGKIDYESMLLDDESFDQDKLQLEEDRYVHWVDGVVTSHKAPTIDEFRVLFDLEDNSTDYIDYWVRFAVEKNVKRLELNFGGFEGGSHMYPYNLPTTLSLCNSLTSLQLACINVTGEALERLLYNCQTLKLLSVTDSHLLVDLKISGPSLNLNSLTILNCFKMKNLEISAPNLISFSYYGQKLSHPFKSTPKLAELSIGNSYAGHLINDPFDFSICVSQLEALTLELTEDIHVMEVFPICPRLKMLDVSFAPLCGEDLFVFSSLIKACPFLHKFVLQLEDLAELEIKRSEMTRQREAYPHKHLKIVEIVGFVGCEVDTGFVKYLVEIAVSLEKIIIDPREPSDIREPRYIGTPWESTKKETVGRAREVANQLSANFKPGIELEIR